ncbi:MAG: DUF167 family protein [Gammaproteobacteria bacterium]|nr:DUF167 family protein [Gammaproteobacteria bacterium]
MNSHTIYWLGNDLYLNVHLQTRAKKDAIIGQHGGSLKITVTAPPIEGKANQHLIKFLAKYFNVTQSQVKIQQGLKSKNKLVLIKEPNKTSAALKNFELAFSKIIG